MLLGWRLLSSLTVAKQEDIRYAYLAATGIGTMKLSDVTQLDSRCLCRKRDEATRYHLSHEHLPERPFLVAALDSGG